MYEMGPKLTIQFSVGIGFFAASSIQSEESRREAIWIESRSTTA